MVVKLLSFINILLFVIALLSISSCNGEKNVESKQTKATSNLYQYTGKLLRKDNQASQNASPLLKSYKDNVQLSLQQTPAVLTLTKKVLASEQAFLAQQIAIINKQFTRFNVHPKTKQALRNEIMTVRPILASDRTTANNKALSNCEPDNCYRVEMYNFFFNLSSVAFVNTALNKVVALSQYSDAQPDLNKNLIKLAIEIAKNSGLVKQELSSAGVDTLEPTMSEIKTSLKNSRCERSHHLCVAPTFVVGDKALWAIVDLTDGELVGTRWTELGTSGPPIEITERQLENEYVFSNFCEKSTHFKKGDWQFDYQITSSDGLQLTNVQFKNKTVMKSAKLLDWHVSYSSRENFGYSDAIGCPLFSSAVVIAYDGPQTKPIKNKTTAEENGFAFVQDFRQPPWPTPCNYRYEQRFEFYKDGRFRVAAADYGRGCGTDGTYRPVLRIDIDVSEGGTEQFSQWNGKNWENWDKEQWNLQTDKSQYTDEGYLFKVNNSQGEGFYVEPNRGQFGDGSKGDFAYTYITVNHPNKDEAKSDMVTIGSCCNTNHQQGPEQFMQPAEPLEKQNLVMWYVPQIKNNGTVGSEYCWADTRVEDGIPKVKVWPCYAGPMFIPISN